MTGYGRGEAESPAQKWIVELRTLNHRFLDLSLNLPKHLWALEDRFRKTIKSRLQRGRLEMQLSWESKPEFAFSLKLDPSLVNETRKMLTELTAAAALEEPLRLEHYLRFADFFITKEREIPEIEEVWGFLAQALSQALDVVDQMRINEGAALAAEMRKYVKDIEQTVARVKVQAETLPLQWQDKIKARTAEILAETGGVDETRLAQEVAFLAERRDITEELTRLESHLVQFWENLQNGEELGPVGRKLEFLLQEMLREVNTIGAKANDLVIAQAVVEVKGCLERLREQVQNIE
ncbi:MAG: YicC/YloC family endoribonuclease [Deltaproteobacteria bacterium]|nr:YicC/YloC family endoribonuclease [Deltaproteobacteria bacterium]